MSNPLREAVDYNNGMRKMMKNRLWVRLLLFNLVFGWAVLSVQSAQAASTTQTALVMTLNGSLTSSMVNYVNRGLDLAKDGGMELVVIQIDTPGGAIDYMTSIVEAIQASPVPVVMYVTPNGGMAGSAGTLITLSGEVVAMAPGTIIGAASPVSSTGGDLSDTEKAKVTNAMVALVNSLTTQRPAAAQALAEDTIKNATAVSAQDAEKVGLADFIASDLNDLFSQLNGVKVKTPTGEMTLDTSNISTRTYSFSLIDQFLDLISDANIVFLLLTVGILCILLELANPGGWIPGLVGFASIGMAIYGLGLLPVNWFGIYFVLMAFVLFIVDLKASTHGALTAAGTASFIAGALVLFNSSSVPSAAHVSVPLVMTAGLTLGALFFWMVTLALRAQKRPVANVNTSLVGKTGLATSSIDPHGSVQMGSELWSADLAEGEGPIASGSQVVVLQVRGLHLIVKKAG